MGYFITTTLKRGSNNYNRFITVLLTRRCSFITNCKFYRVYILWIKRNLKVLPLYILNVVKLHNWVQSWNDIFHRQELLRNFPQLITIVFFNNQCFISLWSFVLCLCSGNTKFEMKLYFISIFILVSFSDLRGLLENIYKY